MARVLLVSDTVASATSLARRMGALDPRLEPVVAPIRALPAAASDCGAVLLAPQLASNVDEVRLLVAPAPLAVLAPDAFAPEGAEAAVMQARELLAPQSYRGAETTETKE